MENKCGMCKTGIKTGDVCDDCLFAVKYLDERLEVADGEEMARILAMLHSYVCQEAQQWVPFSVIAVLLVHEVGLKMEFLKDN